MDTKDLMQLLTVMMAGGHWIPAGQEEFVTFCHVWLNVLEDEAKVTAFGWDKPTVMTLRAALNGFLAAWNTYKMDNSTTNRKKKDMLMDQAKHDMENFADRSIRFNDKMAETDKNELGVYTRDSKPTPVPKPGTVPVLRMLDTSVPRRILFYMKDSLAKNNAKPKGIRGGEMCWGLLDRPPLSVLELGHSSFCSNNRIELVFDEADRGKRLYFAFRWETTATIKGDFSEIYTVIIP
jgi:hypothetical protein